MAEIGTYLISLNPSGGGWIYKREGPLDLDVVTMIWGCHLETQLGYLDIVFLTDMGKPHAYSSSTVCQLSPANIVHNAMRL